MRLLATIVLAVALLLRSTSAGAQDDGPGETDLLLERALSLWTGDFGGMKERGFIRIAVPHNPLFFAFDGEKRAGLAAERGRALEQFLFKKYKRRIYVVFMPKARDVMIPALVAGQVDMIDANLTITEARRKEIDFSLPLRTEVSEVVVTQATLGRIETFGHLTDHSLHLRRSSSYFGHFTALNAGRVAQRLAPVRVITVDEVLEDYDLLEMVHAGIIEATIIDSHKAKLWAQIFDGIAVQENLVVADGGKTAFALRKNSPEFRELLDEFSKKVKVRTQLGNILDQRYLKSASQVKRMTEAYGADRAVKAIRWIRKYADEYEFDWILIAAQAYQESRFDQSTRSPAGAIGIMQVLPSTARDPNVDIADITKAEPNVHAGVRYLRFLRDRYFDSPAITPFNRMLLSLAAYNAGPGNIKKGRSRAEKMGLDPNVWFNNVEIATARAVGGEPVIYVRNIAKYAVDMRLSFDLATQKSEAGRSTAD
ncbi:MAG TPA: transglycosylase SLT domain-containing protein [Alphaproteobacteria bacterium]|nr:transglycosylase SLT domain-containing protein [Alphaproteobacteria bacterium]